MDDTTLTCAIIESKRNITVMNFLGEVDERNYELEIIETPGGELLGITVEQ